MRPSRGGNTPAPSSCPAARSTARPLREGTFTDGTDLGTVFSLPTSGGDPDYLASFGADPAVTADPNDGLAIDSSGDLYGTTHFGGDSNGGEVYEVVAGSLSVTDLASLDNPASGKLAVINGNVFGTESGSSSIFEVVNGSGKATNLYTFPPSVAAQPQSGLILVGDSLIGTADEGGNHTFPEVFGFSLANHTVTTLAPFTSATGSTSPFDSITLGSDGNVYGTAIKASGSAATFFKVSGLPAPRIAFSTQPAGGDIGTTLPAVRVVVSNAPGNNTVTLELGENPSDGTLSGTLTRPVVNGVATFSDLTIDQPGAGYTLVATSGTLLVASHSFIVGPTLTVAIQPPAEVVPDVPFSLTVKVLSPNGTVDTQFNSAVTLSLAPGAASGAALGGTDVVNAVNGVASFNDVTLNDLGVLDTLQASAAGLGTVSTDPCSSVSQVTLTWTGAENQDWSDANNWVDDNGDAQAPSGTGDNLVFPAGAAHTTNVNNLVGLAVNNIEFDAGYVVNGTQLTILGNVTATDGDSEIDCGLDFGEPAAANGLLGAGAREVRPDDNAPPADNTVNVAQSATLGFNGPVVGLDGLTKIGDGTLGLKSLDGLAGATMLQQGTLTLDAKTFDLSSGGPLEVGAAGQTATLATTGASPPTLHRDVAFEGGTVNISGNVTIDGAVTVPNDTTVNMVDNTKASSLTLNSQIAGPGNLTVQGDGGGVDLNGALASTAMVTVLQGTGTEACTIAIGSGTSGTGSIVVNGGNLLCITKNTTFNGNVELQAGSILLGPSSAKAALSLGQAVTVDPPSATTTVTISARFGAALDTPVNLQGGILAVKGILILTGPIDLKQSSEIDPASKSALVLAGDITPDSGAPAGATLTLGGAGDLALDGSLGVAATITGDVSLDPSFSGSAASSLTLMGTGTLTSASSRGIGAFAGKVDAQSGTLVIGGIGPLGTGELDLGSSATAVNLLSASGTPVLTNSSVNVNGPTLYVGTLDKADAAKFGILIGGSVTLAQETVLFTPARAYPTSLVLAGDVSASAKLDVGIPVILSGKVSAPVDVLDGGIVSLTNTVTADSSQTITVDGGTVRSVGVLANFAASIQLNSGTLSVNADGANLGTGTITVQVADGQAAKLVATKTATLDNTLNLDGGKLTTSGPLTLGGAVTLNAGTLDTPSALTISGTLALNGGTLGTTGDIDCTGAVTLNATQLSVGGTVIFAQPFTLTAPTQFALADNAQFRISGGLTGGQSIDVTGAPKDSHKGLLVLNSNIGTTTVTADAGSLIFLEDGFAGTVPTDKKGPQVFELRSNPK